MTRHGSGPGAAALLLALCVAGSETLHAQAADRPGGSGTIEVTITGMRHTRGQVLINLFLSGDGFPSDPKRAYRAVPLAIDAKGTRIVFDAVPAGPFAIAAFHDENGNSALDTNFLGIPRERWGVSRGARGFLGPPSFDSAVLALAAGERVAVAIELR